MGMEAGGRGLLVAAVLAAAAVPVGAPPLTSQLREVLPAAGGFAQAAGLGWAAPGELAPSFQPPDFQTGTALAGGARVEPSDEPVEPMWSEAELEAAGRPAPQRGTPDPREQFLVFESWGAGFNNERMSLEMAYTLALVYCRTLVLPPLVGDRTRFAKQFRYEAFFDIPRLRRGIEHATRGRASLLTAEEFVARIDAAPSAFGLLASVGSSAVDTGAVVNPVKLRPRNMARGRRPGSDSSYFVGLERPEGFSVRILDSFELHESIIVAEPPLALRQSMRPSTRPEQAAQARWPTEGQFATLARPMRVRAPGPSLEEAVVMNIGSERLLGNYYSVIFIPQRRIAVAAHATLRHFLTLRPSLYDAAEQAKAAVQEVLLARRAVRPAAPRTTDSNGDTTAGGGGGRPPPWAAIHNRQGDFELLYPQHWLDASNPSQVLALTRAHAALFRQCADGGGIYYATTYSGLLDKPTEQAQRRAVEGYLLPALRKAMMSKPVIGNAKSSAQAGAGVAAAAAAGAGGTIVMWKDIAARVAAPALGDGADLHGTEWMGIVEMLLCAKAPAGFVGSYASTFTGYIQRLRGGGGPVSLPDDPRAAAGAVDEGFHFTRHEPGAVGAANARDGRGNALAARAPPVSWAGVPSPSAIVWSREWSEGLGQYATER